MNTIFTQLHAGERYAGIIINSATGKPTHHVVLLPEQPTERLSWDEAMAWAASISAELPTLQESALLYANLKSAFESDWYWIGEQYVGNASLAYVAYVASVASVAWHQGFDNGYQSSLDKGYKGHVRAIRRVPITEEQTQMSRFTEEQLKELETIFGLKREEQTLPVRDGVVTENTLVWWRGHHELEHVLASNEWDNIKKNPNIYQLEKPVVVQVIYSD